MECHCYSRHVEDLLSDAKTPHERRFGEPFEGPVIPSGAMFEYLPISSRETSEGSTTSARQFYLEYSSDMHQSRVKSGKEIFWSQTLRS